MGKANDIATIQFRISNVYCRYYREILECGRDEKTHTCCDEECRLPKDAPPEPVVLRVHHEFNDDGVCIHCGDTK